MHETAVRPFLECIGRQSVAMHEEPDHDHRTRIRTIFYDRYVNKPESLTSWMGVTGVSMVSKHLVRPVMPIIIIPS